MTARSDRTQLTVRLSKTTYKTLSAVSAANEMSANAVAAAFIERALAEGWTVRRITTAPVAAEPPADRGVLAALAAYVDQIETDPDALAKIRKRIEEES